MKRQKAPQIPAWNLLEAQEKREKDNRACELHDLVENEPVTRKCYGRWTASGLKRSAREATPWVEEVRKNQMNVKTKWYPAQVQERWAKGS